MQTRDQAEELEAQQKSLRRTHEELPAQQERCSETEQFFRSVLELAPDGLMVADEQGVIRLANAQVRGALRLPARGARSASRSRCWCPDDVRPRHPGLREAFHRAAGPRSMGSGRELHALRKDGSLFPVEIGPEPASRRAAGRGRAGRRVHPRRHRAQGAGERPQGGQGPRPRKPPR